MWRTHTILSFVMLNISSVIKSYIMHFKTVYNNTLADNLMNFKHLQVLRWLRFVFQLVPRRVYWHNRDPIQTNGYVRVQRMPL